MKQLKESAPVAHSRIYVLGAARGSNIVTNDEIAGPIDSSDEWIRQRTGVITRVRAPQDQSLMDLAVEASKEAIEASGIDPAEIDDCIMGAAMQQGTQTMNLGRQVAMASGLPVTVSGMTIDRQCSSGLMAIATGAKQIINDGSPIIVAGGCVINATG